MDSKEVRKKYIDFFKSPPRNHQQIFPAPLVLSEDPTTLFTSSGMQPLVPYLMGEEHPQGKRLVNSQPSIRLSDVDEVGDNRHLTFFEMLGNWSLGDYFKKEQLAWTLEFFIQQLGLPKERLWVSVFEGDEKVVKDTKSYEIWRGLGIAKEKIYYYGSDKNWWSRSGIPKKMPPGEIGGPDSEVFFEFPQVNHQPKFGKQCHPNCNCGRYIEIGNSVFIQYKKNSKGDLEELPQRNVDFGGGLERIAAAVNDTPDVFAIDLFADFIGALEKKLQLDYGKSADADKSMRIIADHIRSSIALISSGVVPSNKEHGYVLRRLIRRALFHASKISKDKVEKGLLPEISDQKKYDYPLKLKPTDEISQILDDEAEKFTNCLRKGIAKLEKVIKDNKAIDGKLVFDLFQTEGLPLELTLEIVEDKGINFSQKEKDRFEQEFEKHKKLSKTASSGMFTGGLADKSEDVIKFHTTTHLLHAALREVLGDHVAQKGSNITGQRLRFDFSHPDKLSHKQLQRVENLINQQIEKNLPVSCETVSLKEAKKQKALAFFEGKYNRMVKVYTIGNSQGGWFSKEVCGGPHVASTGEIGRVRIKKQEKIGSGLVRIYVVFC